VEGDSQWEATAGATTSNLFADTSAVSGGVVCDFIWPVNMGRNHIGYDSLWISASGNEPTVSVTNRHRYLTHLRAKGKQPICPTPNSAFIDCDGDEECLHTLRWGRDE
jgi:hypothetical protein